MDDTIRRKIADSALCGYEIGQDVLYRVRDDLWLAAKVINITQRRIVIKPHGYRAHRNTTASQLRPAPKL